MEKYVAYISTYTIGNKDQCGIKIYDVDLEKGYLKEKDQVEITNSSYITISHDQKYLYSITDFGVESYQIEKDGSLSHMNTASINGMRGCYLSTDYEEKFLFVAGYHDGKLTVLRLNEDGSIGSITDEIYHKAFGSGSERLTRPHICCARMTHDNKYLMVADQSMDHVKVYRLNHDTGKLKLADVIRCKVESAPRHVKMSKDGRFVYIVHEWKCFIGVYRYEERDGMPYFEHVQDISTVRDNVTQGTTASALSFSADYSYLLSTNSGDNSVAVFAVNKEDGTLRKSFILPVSGDYPKDAEIFPENEFLVSLNHESNTMTFFRIDLEKGIMMMNGTPMKIHEPNCITFHKLSE